MSAFDLAASVARAQERIAGTTARRRRSDAGQLRLAPRARAALRRLVLGAERPRMVDLKRALAAACHRAGTRPPARATIYAALAMIEGHRYEAAALPPHVRAVLYNLDPSAAVPGHQLAFYCFNYGALDVVSFAAGLPWLDLYQAARLGGWRPRSRGLLEAVLRTRGIA
jgi:hypothetical protein